jgi:tight adherence protein B
MQTAIIRLFILVAIFATIFLVTQLLFATVLRGRLESVAVNRRLKMIAGGAEREVVIASLRKNSPRYDENYPPIVRNVLNHFRRMLLASGLNISMWQVMLMMAGLVFAITVLLMFVARSAKIPLTLGVMEIILTFGVALAVAVPMFILNFMAQRRRRKVEQQFPIALDIFVRALRSGHPIASAIQLLTEEMEDPIGSEFGLVSDEVSYGAELADALFAMAERWDLDDIRMFVVSLMVQNETGGNLAEILENLAEVIRARASMYLKVRALSSEGRMTGWVLTGAPVFAFVSLFISNPKFYMDVAMDRMFLIGFPGLIVLYFIGFFTIRNMIDLKV